jgi:RNA-directed DNA polymerase
MNMHADEKSDEGIRAEKRPNKGGSPPAEAVEQRTSPKGNGGRTAAARTPSREAASNGLAAVRQAARRSKHAKFSALLHHITADLLKQSFQALERNAAFGTDGVPLWFLFLLAMRNQFRIKLRRGRFLWQTPQRRAISLS